MTLPDSIMQLLIYAGTCAHHRQWIKYELAPPMSLHFFEFFSGALVIWDLSFSALLLLSVGLSTTSVGNSYSVRHSLRMRAIQNISHLSALYHLPCSTMKRKEGN